jgi:hypothetical protein
VAPDRKPANVKAVARWCRRDKVKDTQMGPKKACSTVPTTDEEAVIVAFRRHTLLPLDDCLMPFNPRFPASSAPVFATPRYQPPSGYDGP